MSTLSPSAPPVSAALAEADELVVDLSPRPRPTPEAPSPEQRYAELERFERDWIADPARPSRRWLTDDEVRELIDADRRARPPLRLLVLDEIVGQALLVGEGLSARELRAAIDGSNSAIDRVRDGLIAEGLVERRARAGRGGGVEFVPAGWSPGA